ncbi:MAG: yteR 2, partial [Lacunisphaera sp.]|nr:yteR 2 [Lacunisphaera sp.]
MIPRCLLCSVAVLAFGSPVLRAEMTPEEITGMMEGAADWQFRHPAKWKPLEWQNGAFYAGVMALTKSTRDARFLDQMVKLGEVNRWQLGPRPYHADDHAVGQTYAELFLREHDPRMIAPMQETFDAILAHPKDDNLDFNSKKNPDRFNRWSWCDTLFMAPPAWIRLWAATGNRAYLDYAVNKWWVTSDYLYDQDEHLYYRDSGYFGKQEKNGKKIFWARGNGWVLAGLVRMLQFLPADHPARPRFLAQFREMADKVLAGQ